MIIDLFAGMGGWSEGLAALDRHDVGIEKDVQACRTRVAAGHATIRADVGTFPLGRLIGQVEGVIASPPCTDWSQSGKRAGLDGETGALVLEVDRWVRALRPGWVACEQVPPAVEWWHRFADEWRALGYSTWSGILNAADYGVPQTRKRAFLIASLTHPVGPPRPTCAESPMPALFGPELRPWVSMASALGWVDAARVGFPRLDDRGDSPDGYRERDWRAGDEPAFTLTEKARSWVVQTGNNSHVTSRVGSKAGEGGVELYERSITEPAPTLDRKVGGAWRILHRNRGQDADGNRQTRAADAPAPALTSKAGPQWEWGDGTTDGSAMGQGIKLSIADALVLQSFRPDYPVTGNKTKQFEQVGNAVPPRLAMHVLAEAIGVSL